MMVGGGRGIGNVISKLQTAHPDAAIIGGVATGRWLVRAHAHRLEYVRNGVVGLMFRGNVPLTALVCSGSPLAQLRDAKRELHEQNKALLGGLLFTCTARDEEEDANAFATTFPQVSVRPLARRSTLFLRVTRRHVLTHTHALSLPTYPPTPAGASGRLAVRW